MINGIFFINSHPSSKHLGLKLLSYPFSFSVPHNQISEVGIWNISENMKFDMLWKVNLKTWCLHIWGVNTLSCLQYKNIIVDKNQSIPYFSPHCGIQCSIPSKVCPLRKRLPLSSHKNSSQIFDATKLGKDTIPLTYNTKTLISNISETHRFSPQMRLIAYPDHKTTQSKHKQNALFNRWNIIAD